MKYNLNDLHWQQFEVFSFRCLQKIISTGIQFVEGGNDKGRDIIFTGISTKFQPLWNGKWIFQIKHKSFHGMDQSKSVQSLLNDLNVELDKVFIKNKLEFNNYVFVTNLIVSPNIEDKAQEIFKLFCDNNKIRCNNFFIFGYRHFESCIDDTISLKWSFPSIISHPDFELLCRSIFDSVLNNRNIGWLNNISKYRKYFIYTNFYQEANEKLKKYHVILLSGPPKCGKTFNAEILVLNFAGENDFNPLKIDALEEIERYYNQAYSQIFFCDDAFGSNELTLSNADDWDRKIEGILSLSDETHKFVFTSREHIFKAFKKFANNFEEKHIEKITVNNDKLTLGEKSAIFDRYLQLSILNQSVKHSLIENEDIFIRHKNFSPESIRAFFANLSEDTNSKYLIIGQLIAHLNKPDEYLINLFFHFDESKRVLLLAILCSFNHDIREIGNAYSNLCNDIGAAKLESYKSLLEELEGGILKTNKNCDFTEVEYYHPSMKEGLIEIIKNDENGTIHSSVLKNLNLELLNFCFFDSLKTNKSNAHVIGIKQCELEFLSIGLQRLINNESFRFQHILRLFKWFTFNSNSLIKVLDKPFYSSIKKLLFEFLDYVKTEQFWVNYKNESISNWSEIIWCLKSLGLVYSIDLKILYCDYWIIILNEGKKDADYWKFVLRLSNFIDEQKIIRYVGREWLNVFFITLRKQFSELGNEIYGSEYPFFQTYNSLSEENKRTIQRIHYIKKRPDKSWYDRFLMCKEKIKYLKDIKGNKIGQPIIDRLENEYEILLRISDIAFKDEYNW